MTTEQFADILGRARPTEVERWLVWEKAQSNVAELTAYSALLESHLPIEAESSGFLEYFALIKGLKISHVQAVFSTPQGYFWNAVARTLLDVAIRGGEWHPLLTQYARAFGDNLKLVIDAHLREFGRFALAALLKAGQHARFNRPVQLKEPNVLPGTGVALFDELTRGEFEIRELDHDLMDERSPRLPLHPWPGVTAVRMPSWTGPHGMLVVDSWDPVFNLPWVECYPRLRQREQCERFAMMLAEAIQHIDQCDPGLAESISLMIRSITPMDTRDSGAAMCSGTFSPMFGGCFLSDTEEPMFLAEMLIHEFCHTRLRLAQERMCLFEPDSPTGAMFYSPWRDDPRPLDAIAHGIFVFARIAHFWSAVRRRSESRQTRTLALRRLGTLLYQLRYAFGELTDNARLSPYGTVFARTLGNSISELERSLLCENYDSLHPFFSGLIRDVSLRQANIRHALPQHRANWQTAHGRETHERRV